jgi:hypothetical protein
MKSETGGAMKQRTISVPKEIDELAQRMQAADPDMSYSVALRKILRAGMQSIGIDESISYGSTQIDMEAMRDPRVLERMR